MTCCTGAADTCAIRCAMLERDVVMVRRSPQPSTITDLGKHVELYLMFFYQLDVVGRAAVLVHESRHFGGRGHDANFPTGSVFRPGRPGADSSWRYQGAWTYHALYLWWFYAAGTRTTNALKQSAKQFGNLIIDNAFVQHPGFTIS